jgi:hypothetical protein
MYRIVDLDQVGKDSDGYVFLISVGGEKVGFSDAEIADMLRARPATKGGKKSATRQVKGATAADSEPMNEPEAPSESAPSPEL